MSVRSTEGKEHVGHIYANDDIIANSKVWTSELPASARLYSSRKHMHTLKIWMEYRYIVFAGSNDAPSECSMR